MLEESVNSVYPVASKRGHRRRRILAMLASAEFEAQMVDETANELIETDNASTSPSETATPDTPSPASDPELSTADDTTRIQELLEDVQPRTWVFTGDCLGFDVQHARRDWTEHFSDYIREQLRRTHDIILNSTVTNSTIDRLRRDIEWRVLRFQPDVVIITPGLEDCIAHGTEKDFKTSLLDLVEFLHNEGCMVVLSTPPCPVLSDSSRQGDGNTIRKTAVSHIRDVATECGTVLSDHYSHWQVALEEHGSTDPLHDEAGQHPSEHGHRELAQRLLKSLDR